MLDVTNNEHVQALRRRLEKECPKGLYALVNNAGKQRQRGKGKRVMKCGSHDTVSSSPSMPAPLSDPLSLLSVHVVGVGQAGLVDWMPLDGFRQIMEVRRGTLRQQEDNRLLA
jgi:NAD(P)-dependent dehydrogenase (short-subunit alcohol dehydrogenase family)